MDDWLSECWLSWLRDMNFNRSFFPINDRKERNFLVKNPFRHFLRRRSEKKSSRKKNPKEQISKYFLGNFKSFSRDSKENLEDFEPWVSFIRKNVVPFRIFNLRKKIKWNCLLAILQEAELVPEELDSTSVSFQILRD